MTGIGFRIPVFLIVGVMCLTSSCAPPVGPPGPVEPPMISVVESMEVDSNTGRREALEAFLTALGVAYQAESFTIPARTDYPRTEGANLVVTIGDGDRDIVVGGHYDAAWLPGGALSRGAVDNAASVAILAHLAVILGRMDLEHRIRIVFFDMEEIGLRGSRSYIDRHADDPIVAAVNLDVNAYGDTLFYGPAAEPGNALLYKVMRDHCAASGLACVEAPAYPASDYMSFQASGIPNISFSIFPAVEAHQLWLFLNGGRDGFETGFAPTVFQTIHTTADTSAMVEPGAMDLGVESLVGFLEELDAALD